METIYSKMHSVWNAFYVITVAYTFTIVPIYIRKGENLIILLNNWLRSLFLKDVTYGIYLEIKIENN